MSKKRRPSKLQQRRKLEVRLRRTGRFDPSPPGLLELDRFSDMDVEEWVRFATDFQAYHYQWFFELEAQRAASAERIREALTAVRPITVDLEGWGRVLAWRYTNAPLSAVGSLTWVGGRFNYGIDIDGGNRFAAFPALYLASSFETGLKEMLGQPPSRLSGLSRADLALCDETSFSWVTVAGTVNNVFDLTKPSSLAAFTQVIREFRLSDRVRELQKRVRPQHPLRLVRTPTELLESIMVTNWRELPVQCDTPANSQVIGRLVADSGYDGILYRSTKTGERNLAVFTRNLAHSDSVIRVAPEPPAQVRLRQLDASNYGDAERVD